MNIVGMNGIRVTLCAGRGGNIKNFALQGFPIFSYRTWQVLFESVYKPGVSAVLSSSEVSKTVWNFWCSARAAALAGVLPY